MQGKQWHLLFFPAEGVVSISGMSHNSQTGSCSIANASLGAVQLTVELQYCLFIFELSKKKLSWEEKSSLSDLCQAIISVIAGHLIFFQNQGDKVNLIYFEVGLGQCWNKGGGERYACKDAEFCFIHWLEMKWRQCHGNTATKKVTRSC